MTHTAPQKVKHLILKRHAHWKDGEVYPIEKMTGEEIDAAYQALVDADDHWDAMSEVREGEVETGVECDWSRYYESKSVGARLDDGSWVGWTYWYGGGKHGEPEGVEWIGDAYDLSCSEEEKMVTVRTFAKAEAVTP